MKVSYVEGVANHNGPESCGAAREGGVEALTGGRAGRVLSREINALLRCLGSAGNGEAAFSVSVDSAPSGRGFSRHEGLSSDGFFLAVHSARGLAPALLSIGSMSPTRLSLSMVASLQCLLPFHPARSL